jgi:hypothetical protein
LGGNLVSRLDIERAAIRCGRQPRIHQRRLRRRRQRLVHYRRCSLRERHGDPQGNHRQSEADRQPAPVAPNRRVRAIQNTPLRLDLLEGAHDPDGDTLTVRLLTQPRHGKLIAHADGRFTHTPAPGWLGEDTFTYRVSDGQLDSNTATVTLVVTLAQEARTNNDGSDRPGQSASITFQSAWSDSRSKPKSEPCILLRGSKANTPPSEAQNAETPIPKIDWNALPPVIAVAPLWLPAFLTKKDEEEELTPQRLAEITGLKFPIDPRDRSRRDG